MKTKNEIFERLDDLIFENRNQEYGAYAIRKSYSDHMNIAFLIALSIATLLAMLPFISSLWKDGHVVKIIQDAIPPIIIDKDVPSIELLPQKKIPASHPASQNVVPTQVTTDVTQADNIDITATTTTITEPGDTPGELLPSNGEVGPSGPTTEGTVTTSTPPIVSGIMAEYVGGPEAMARFLKRNLKYPTRARSVGLEGTVYVSFIIDTNGKVIRAEILRGIGKECDEEAKRVVSLMPGWIAAHQNGMPVMVRMVLPIKFTFGYE